MEHTDAEIGLVPGGARALGCLDDTVLVLMSDNGAGREGCQHEVLNTVARADEIDGRTAQVNYPLGWVQAANTPLKRYKQNAHAGGIRTPMILRLPKGARGGRRTCGRTWSGFQHISDIAPPMVDLLGIEPPSTRTGVDMQPIAGHGMRAVRDDGEATAVWHRTQYFETDGRRAIWRDGCKAAAFHRRGTDFANDEWGPYHVDEDFSETHDLATQQPARLKALVDTWWREARTNQALTLDDRGFAERSNARFRPDSPRDRTTFTYLHGMQHRDNGAAAPVAGRSYRFSATVERDIGTENGVLIAHGSWNSGYALLIESGHLVYDLNHCGHHRILRSAKPLPPGRCDVAAPFRKNTDGSGSKVTLTVCGQQAVSSTWLRCSSTSSPSKASMWAPTGCHPSGTTGSMSSVTGRMDNVGIALLDTSTSTPHEPRH